MYEQLPGGDILERGLKSLRSGAVDEDSLLLMMAANRLTRCGIQVPQLDIGHNLPEHALFNLLQAKHGADAYRLYRSLTRRLVSLEHAIENAATSPTHVLGGMGRTRPA